jgi:hypothetical protein
MNSQCNSVCKGLLAFVSVAAMIGCAPAAVMNLSTVPNPVLLAGPSHFKTEKKTVDVEVTCARVEVSNGNSSVSAVIPAESDKGAKEVIKALPNSDALDVQLKKLTIGAYNYGLGSLGVMKNWVRVRGGFSEGGKEKQQ